MVQGTPAPLLASFANICDAEPDREAIVSSEGSLTYAKLFSYAERLAEQLKQCGVQPLEKFAWVASSNSHFFVSFYAATHIGAVGLPLDMYAPAEQWFEQCQTCDVRLLLLSPEFAARGMEVFTKCPALRRVEVLTIVDDEPVLVNLARRAGEYAPGVSLPGDVLILPTSGTTKKPRGVILTQIGLHTNLKAVAQALQITPQDTLILVKSLSHSSTLIEALSVLAVGGRLLLQPWLTARGILAQLDRAIPSMLCVVPTMVHDILAQLRRERKMLPLRVLSISGAPIASRILRDVGQYLPHGGVYHAYGLTEASPRVSILLPQEFAAHEQSVGRPIAQVITAIVDEDGQQLMPGQAGELIVRGPAVMRGYYNSPEASAYALRQGWLHTGDRACIDSNGYIYLKGRLDEQLNYGGQKMYPGEIEQVLLEHPSVLEAVVYGISDDRLGQIPAAYITPSPSCPTHKDEILRFCRERLPAYKVPRQILLGAPLPRTSSGKVRRASIAERGILDGV